MAAIAGIGDAAMVVDERLHPRNARAVCARHSDCRTVLRRAASSSFRVLNNESVPITRPLARSSTNLAKTNLKSRSLLATGLGAEALGFGGWARALMIQ